MAGWISTKSVAEEDMPFAKEDDLWIWSRRVAVDKNEKFRVKGRKKKKMDISLEY